MAETSSSQPPPSNDAGATPASPTARKIAPIPPKKAAPRAEPGEPAPGAAPKEEPGGAGSGGEERARDPQTGRFLPAREEGLPDILQPTEGVDDDYDRAKVSLDGGLPESAVVPKITKKQRARDVVAPPTVETPAGVEAAPGEEAPAEGEVVAPPEGAPVPDPADDGEIVLADDLKFRNREHLTQSLRSLRGMYVSAEKARTQLKTANQTNFHAATAWQGVASKYRNKLVAAGLNPDDDSSPASPSTGTPGAGTAPGTQGAASPGSAQAAAAKVSAATGATEESILKSIDWNRYKQIREAHDAETALVWVVDQVTRNLTQRYDSRLEDMTRPSKEAEALMKEGTEVGALMDELSTWTYEGTTDPIYPELSDEAAANEIAQVIVKLHEKGQPLSYLKTHEGLHTAILTWRDWRARNKRPWSPAGSTTSTTPTPAPDPVAAATEAVRRANATPTLPLTGRNAAIRPAPPSNGRGADIVRGIVEADKATEFGWSR